MSKAHDHFLSLRFHLGDHYVSSHRAPVKGRLLNPDDVAARKALAARPNAPLERVLEQAACSQRSISDQLRESRSEHLLKTHEEAIAQMRLLRED
jgi:hypothetical protein